MPESTLDLYQIRRDVALAMAITIVEKTRYSRSNYSEAIVPSDEPPDGFGATVAFWAYIIGIVEGRLEQADKRYAVFDASENFVRQSRKAMLQDTNNKIAIQIHNQLSTSGEMNNAE